MRYLLTISFILFAFSAYAETTEILIYKWINADGDCRGSTNPSITEPFCEKREIIGNKLDKRGWCFGKNGQGRAEMLWHKCGPNSIR